MQKNTSQSASQLSRDAKSQAVFKPIEMPAVSMTCRQPSNCH